MPTDAADAVNAVALFLFAHQDDDYGVYHELERCRQRGVRVRCAYLTDGAASGVSAATRNAESVAVLAQLGVARDDIFFAGESLGIPDAGLPLHLERAGDWLRHWFASQGEIDAIYVMAWEGGHHDHDALHAIAVHIASQRGQLGKMRQYALYNGARIMPPFFRTLSPLAENGPVQARRLPWATRWRCLRWCLSYPSQYKTWLGLFPFALWAYLVVGKQCLQAVSLARTFERPHAGTLYYEHRRFYTWPQMQEQLTAWRKKADARQLNDS